MAKTWLRSWSGRVIGQRSLVVFVSEKIFITNNTIDRNDLIPFIQQLDCGAVAAVKRLYEDSIVVAVTFFGIYEN